MSLSGYIAAGGLLLSVASGLGGYFHGLDTGKTRAQNAAAKAVQKATDERDALRRQMEHAALLHLQADQTRQDTHRGIIRESTQIVARPPYRNQCVDADGMRLLDRATDNANARSSSSPAASAG